MLFYKYGNKHAQTKLKEYIYNHEGALSGIEKTELLNVYNNEKDYTNSQSLIDDVLTSGLGFDRQSYVPEGVTYDKGIVPATELRFLQYLRKANKEINSNTYNSYASTKLADFKKQMTVYSGEYNDSPLSTGVLLYSSNLLNSDFRAGTYINDMNPLTWLQSGYDTSAMISFLEEAQIQSKGLYTKEGLLVPYYVRALPENAAYGTYDTFVFSGFMANSMNAATVQYQTLNNIAEYCYYGQKYNGELDLDAFQLLSKGLHGVLSFPSIPTNFQTKNITFDDDSITFDNVDITFDRTSVIQEILTGENIKGFAHLGNALILAYKIKQFREFFDKAREIFEYIISKQGADGRIGTEDFETNLICFKFMAEFNNFYKETGYDLINKALNMCYLTPIGETNITNHPQNFIIDEYSRGVQDIFRNQFYEFQRKEYSIPYPSDTVDLLQAGIDPHRIESVEYYNSNGSRVLLDIGVYQEYLQSKLSHPAANRPQRYYLFADKLYLNPSPDSDYNIKIVYFKEPKTENLFEIADFPIEFYPAIKYYLAYKICVAIANPLYNLFLEQYNNFSGLLMNAHRNDFTSKRLKSNIDFRGNKQNFRQFQTWDGR